MATAGLMLPGMAFSNALAKPFSLTILHTNDQHSRIDPFPMDGGRNAGKGGFAKRLHLIDTIRKQEQHVLLLDAGDIFQGTPYFNMFDGELEMKLMSKARYDVSTMGNHDFDIGLEGFVAAKRFANFPFVVANYETRGTVLDGQIMPFTILEKGPLKVGIFGLGIEMEGLVPAALYGDVRYLDPIAIGRQISEELRFKHKCDLVICLSHLGYAYKSENRVHDLQLARETSEIDIILGGHTHTFLDSPTLEKNLKKNSVLINQAGWAGLVLGRIDIQFDTRLGRPKTRFENILVG